MERIFQWTWGNLRFQHGFGVLQKRHRVEKLEFGVLYNVSARLTKTDDTGENFTSESLTTNFTTALPDGEDSGLQVSYRVLLDID